MSTNPDLIMISNAALVTYKTNAKIYGQNFVGRVILSISGTVLEQINFITTYILAHTYLGVSNNLMANYLKQLRL